MKSKNERHSSSPLKIPLARHLRFRNPETSPRFGIVDAGQRGVLYQLLCNWRLIIKSMSGTGWVIFDGILGC